MRRFLTPEAELRLKVADLRDRYAVNKRHDNASKQRAASALLSLKSLESARLAYHFHHLRGNFGRVQFDGGKLLTAIHITIHLPISTVSLIDMSEGGLEYQVGLLVGYEAASVLRSALERCRDGRYRMRDRREQLLGEFVDTWQDLGSTIRRANLAVTQMHYRSTRDRAYKEIQEATAYSRRAVTALSSCLPVHSMARVREQEEKFLFNLARDYSIATLVSGMPAMGEQVKLAIQFSIREEEDALLAGKRLGIRGDAYTSGVYAEDGYASYTSSRNSSTRALPAAYGNSYSTPRITYAAPLEDYDLARSGWNHTAAAEPSSVYREPPRMRDYSSPIPRSVINEYS